MGTNDLAKETRARFTPGRAPMLAWLSIAVAAARAYDLDILDGVYNGLQDEAGFRRRVRAGPRPRLRRQDARSIRTRSPPPTRCSRRRRRRSQHARAIIAAFDRPENAGKGAISLDGRMVERLHAEMARRTVAFAEAIAARG